MRRTISSIYKSNKVYVWSAGTFDKSQYSKAAKRAAEARQKNLTIQDLIVGIEQHPHRMNGWEKQFFESIKGFTRLSRRQSNCLFKLYVKCTS